MVPAVRPTTKGEAWRLDPAVEFAVGDVAADLQAENAVPAPHAPTQRAVASPRRIIGCGLPPAKMRCGWGNIVLVASM